MPAEKCLVVATGNRGKVREIKDLLREWPWEIRSLADYPDMPEIEESGTTFAENAAIKALAVADYTGFLTMADDSGLEVDVLGGLPGVRSARYSGPGATDARNNAKLLIALRGVLPERRGARFKCAVAIAVPGRILASFEGSCEGTIGTEPRGQNGFGYDPLFEIPALGRTMAELSLDEKNHLSHRAIAIKQAVDWLKCGWEL